MIWRSSKIALNFHSNRDKYSETHLQRHNVLLLTNQHYPLSNQGDAKVSQRHLTFAEYFSGIGLVRLGLEQAGWKASFANDWATEKFEMYSAYFRDAHEYNAFTD